MAYFRPIIREQSEGIPLQRTRAGKGCVATKGNPIAVAGNMLFVDDDTAYLIYGDNRTGLPGAALADSANEHLSLRRNQPDEGVDIHPRVARGTSAHDLEGVRAIARPPLGEDD